MYHQLEKLDSGPHCQVCGISALEEKTLKWETCETVPVYDWFDKIDNPDLKTKTQLKELGLKPGKIIRGQVYWKRKRVTYDLYDVKEALERPKATEAQLSALEKARHNKDLKERTCVVCKKLSEAKLQVGDNEDFDMIGNVPGGLPVCYDCREAAEDKEIARAESNSIRWARNLLSGKKGDWVVLDVETTGLPQDVIPEIVQIAVLAGPTGEVLFDTLVKPKGKVRATHIHGITDEMVSDAPGFGDIYQELCRVLAGKLVVAFNAHFDKERVHSECYRRELPDPPVSDWLDAKVYYDAYCGEIHWGYDREEGQRYWNWWWQRLPGGNHTALGDCQALLNLIKSMATSQVTVLIPPREKTRRQEELEQKYPFFKAKVDEPEAAGPSEEQKLVALGVPALPGIGG